MNIQAKFTYLQNTRKEVRIFDRQLDDLHLQGTYGQTEKVNLDRTGYGNDVAMMLDALQRLSNKQREILHKLANLLMTKLIYQLWVAIAGHT